MMNEQEKREKTIKELEYAKQHSLEYDTFNYVRMDFHTLYNAIALLKAQEPCEDAVSMEAKA